MSAVPLAGVFAGPISGWILARMAGVQGLTSWQWLFLAEGIPSLLIGVITLYFLPDSPTTAKWLNKDEKRFVQQQLDEEEEVKKLAGGGGHRLIDAFRSPKVWLMCLIYFGIVMGNYGLGFWLPQVLKETVTTDPIKIGWLSAIPWGAATIAMIWAGHHSDKTGERRWHIAIAAFLGAAAFAASAIPGIPGAAGVLTLTLAAMGIEAAIAMFWALPTGLLSGAAAAAGIAWVNSVGNLAGYVSPWVVGLIRDKTHSMFAALLVLAGAALVSGVVTLFVAKRPKKNS
jgi:nitrate/nitrite transporter NarK